MEDDDMLTQPPESPRRDDDGQLYTQPPEETGGAPQRVRMAFALVPERNVADVFCPQMADLAAMTETTVGRTVDNDIVLEMPDVPNMVSRQRSEGAPARSFFPSRRAGVVFDGKA